MSIAIFSGLGQVSSALADKVLLGDQSSSYALSYDTVGGVLASMNAPDWFLINGRISASVASNNLTVSIVGIDGNAPSATNPVYVRINNAVRPITSSLSVTKNAGTNWCNSWGTGLATNEIDYFVYLGYNATDGVVVGFSRIPYALKYGDFSATSTNQSYCAISTISNATSTDPYVVVWRFNATLSAGAGYTWSIPATPVVINRPIYQTRVLTFSPTITGDQTINSVSTFSKYQINMSVLSVWNRFAFTPASPATVIYSTIPFLGTATNFEFMGEGNYYNGTANGIVHGYLDTGTPRYYWNTIPFATGFPAAGSAITCNFSTPIV